MHTWTARRTQQNEILDLIAYRKNAVQDESLTRCDRVLLVLAELYR